MTVGIMQEVWAGLHPALVGLRTKHPGVVVHLTAVADIRQALRDGGTTSSARPAVPCAEDRRQGDDADRTGHRLPRRPQHGAGESGHRVVKPVGQQTCRRGWLRPAETATIL
ncbi:hypothetical protein ACFVU4_22735 [Streptomyces sp. NPDC058107]|uniref:hypothetical protein n=1 Tax=Streptomyces sp. NPDC058107 TaxID=3346343 RepID=UPI0036E8B4C5